MTTLIRVIAILAVIWFVGTLAVENFFQPPTTPTAIVNSEPTGIIDIQPTPTVEPEPTPTLAHGEAQRVRFAVGTYGQTLTVDGQQTFVLWAAEGQVMRVSGQEGMVARLTAPGGDDVAFGERGALLPANGDYLLTVAGTDAISIDIRRDSP